MKRILLPPTLVLALAATGSIALAQTTYTDRVAAVEVAAAPGSATFVGVASGQLPGTFTASASYAPPTITGGETNTVAGGTWTLNVRGRGSLTGVIEPGGTITWNADATLGTVDVELTILGGTGAFVGATGSGTFDGVLSHITFPPTLRGILTLTF
jgi:hypothetical protein